uniref:Uncharacterized protein n=1 Tax=Strigamia maritima TaxID=126957 RepID=T1IR72_STRMM
MTNFMRILALASTLGFSGFFYESYKAKKQNNDQNFNYENLKLVSNHKYATSSYLKTLNTSSKMIRDKWQNLSTKVFAADDAFIDDDDIPFSPEGPPPMEFDSDYSDESGFDPDEAFEEDIGGVVPNVMRNRPLFRYSHDVPNQFMIDYIDFKICYIKTCDGYRMPLWTTERITCKNVEEIEHRHWEFITVEPKVYHRNFDFVNDTSKDIVLVEGEDLHPDYDPLSTNLNCYHCKRSTFWNHYYNYIKFLTQMYNTVFILSFVLYDLAYSDDYQQNYAKVAECGGGVEPTHYVKVIFCDNGNETSRLECYKVRNMSRKSKPHLSKFNVSRAELINESGLPIFELIPEETIRFKTAHPGFMQ